MKAIFGAAAFMLAASGAWAQQTTLVVNSWGGAYEKLHKQLVFECHFPFKSRNRSSAFSTCCAGR